MGWVAVALGLTSIYQSQSRSRSHSQYLVSKVVSLQGRRQRPEQGVGSGGADISPADR
jgi:hypothetical protein